jgi:hypothetical protein
MPGFLLYSHIYARSTTASHMEQSASVIVDAACSVGVRPVVTSVPVLAAVYATPIGPAQAVNSTTAINSVKYNDL